MSEVIRHPGKLGPRHGTSAVPPSGPEGLAIRTRHELTLAIARVAVDTPMGAQNYQQQIISRAAPALARVDTRPWSVHPLRVRSLRSPLPGERRLPMSAVAGASAPTRRAIGRLLYGRATAVHRMSLELPPAPHADVMTLHDVVAWRFDDESPPVPAAVEEARRADAVVCVSEFTANEAESLLGVHNPRVIHNGVDARFFDAVPLTQKALRAHGITAPFILHAGGASVRKNLESLAHAWSSVRRARPDVQLVLAGPEHPRRTELFARLDGVHLVGRIADESFPGLVAAAACVVVPSTYEGFGLPVLEAMAANVPVVAAARSSLPEVAGDAGILVPPTAAGLTEGLIDVLSATADVDRLVRAGRERAAEFTWERAAAAHARVWSEVA